MKTLIHMSSSSVSATIADGVAFFRATYNFDSKILNFAWNDNCYLETKIFSSDLKAGKNGECLSHFLITLIDTVTESKIIKHFLGLLLFTSHLTLTLNNLKLE